MLPVSFRQRQFLSLSPLPPSSLIGFKSQKPVFSQGTWLMLTWVHIWRSHDSRHSLWWDPSMELGLSWCRCQEVWAQIHPTWGSPVFPAIKPLFPFVINQDGKETLRGYASTLGLFVLRYWEPKLGPHTWGKHAATELGQLLYQVWNSLTFPFWSLPNNELPVS